MLLFAILQMAGLRATTRNRNGRTTSRSAFEIRKRVAAPPDAMWALIRDLESIGRFYPVLQRVAVDGGRLGARRTCEDRHGNRWSEDVVAWDEDAHAVTFRFDTDAPDFPFPVDEMVGGWTAEGEEASCDVVVWLAYTVCGGLLGEVLAPLVAQRSTSGLVAAIQHGSRGHAQGRCTRHDVDVDPDGASGAFVWNARHATGTRPGGRLYSMRRPL